MNKHLNILFPQYTLWYFILILICASQFTCNISTATLADVRMCDEINSESGACGEDSPIFSQEAPAFHVTTKLNYAPEDTKVTFSWYGFNNNGRYVIDAVTIRAGDFGSGSAYRLHSNLNRGEQIWPKGEYEVVIELDSDNSTPISKKFSVN